MKDRFREPFEILRGEILQLAKLIDRACLLEQREVESKLVRLKELLTEYGVFQDPKMKLLIFTEHKDTLDYLVGHGREGQPLGKLREWGLSVTRIHGSMKIGDRETPGTRIYAERLKRDYWLYVVFHCASTPEVHPIQDPARLVWEPVVKIEHYQVGAKKILGAER